MIFAMIHPLCEVLTFVAGHILVLGNFDHNSVYGGAHKILTWFWDIGQTQGHLYEFVEFTADQDKQPPL